ncbi:MAG TPA: lactonase family protein [Opitutaceae bacterium]|nr:lactonase family protein [Opitutaceae bacterium]
MGARTGLHRLFVGTYTRGASRGIYSVSLDAATGALGAPELAAEAPNPTFLALSPGREFLYAVCAGPAWASSFRIDPASPRLLPVQQLPPGDGPMPCHIAVDTTGRFALAANYHLGLAAAIPLGADGTLGPPRVVAHAGRGPHPTRQTAPHVHSTNIAPDNRFALVCDLGLDRIYTYAIDRHAVALAPGTPPFVSAAPGSGPRHLEFDGTGRRVYAINELANTIVGYSYDPQNGGLASRQTVSVLPEGYRGNALAAEIAAHPNGRFLYGSCRGPDTLAVFAVDGASGDLSSVETVPCGGRGPRHFSVSPDGQWLVCAHQDSDTLCAFRADGDNGRLRRIPGSVSVPAPVCALFLD